MKKIVMKYFHSGVDKQKRCDATFLVSKPSTSDTKKWTVEQKIMGRAWINDIEGKFNYFKESFLKDLN
jgi:hypothetical protein